MALRFDETWHRLHVWTHGQTPSERLAAQVLLDAGYVDIDPIHPLGGPDGGKDAIAKNGVHGMAFVTNQELTASQRADLRKEVGVPLDLFHLERLVAALDKPAMHGVRHQYLNIKYGNNGQERLSPPEGELLESALRAAGVRRMQRLRAAGVAEERRPQVDTWMRAHQRQPLVIPPGRSVLLLSAPMGYGKTELAHDWLEKLHS
jgi:hypothetical protein